jgi:outer membrane protein
MRRWWPIVLSLLLPAGPALARGESVQEPLTLRQALEMAATSQPLLRQSQADLAIARAGADQSRASLLPQVSFSSKYQFGPSKQNPNQADLPVTNLGTYALSLDADQLLYDFGQSQATYGAALARVTAQDGTVRQTMLDVRLRVRTAFFTVRANQALVAVARETLTNREIHQRRIRHLVDVGLRAPIDLAQATKDVTNARLALVNAETAERTAKAQLNQAIGTEGPTDYRVAEDVMAVVSGEEAGIDGLVEEAVSRRPDLAALTAQIQAQTLLAEAAGRSWYPSLKASSGAATNGTPTANPSFNWNAGVGLSWPIFAGGEQQARAEQARATLLRLHAQTDLVRQQVRLLVEQSRLAVAAARAAVAIAADAIGDARTQLTMAESRYAAGLGSVLELGTAQQAYTDARAQEVQENLKLATARSQLLQALGRE